LNGEAGCGAGAGVHSGPSGVVLIDVVRSRARPNEAIWGIQRHDTAAVLGFGCEPAATT